MARFVEKPDLDTARKYLADGGYFWNSGMFMFKASTYPQGARNRIAPISTRHAPPRPGACRAIWTSNGPAQSSSNSPSESIDYAVMEKTRRSVVLPINVGWSDVGSWKALWEVSPRDDGGNHIRGDVVTVDTSGSLLISEGRLLATVGVQGSDGRRNRRRGPSGAARPRSRRKTRRRKVACDEAFRASDASTRVPAVGKLRDSRAGRAVPGQAADA